MNRINKYIFRSCLMLSCLLAFSCKEMVNELETGNDYAITSQADVNKFNVVNDIRTLTISGADVTDLSSLKFKTVKRLIISNTGLTDLVMPNLTSVTVEMVISNNDTLKSISNLDNLKFFSGTFTIDNNPILLNIKGLMHFKTFTGELIVQNNDILGEDFPNAGDYTEGFFPLKYLANSGIINGKVILTNNHPAAATDVARIGQMAQGDVLDYVIGSRADAEAFAPRSESVNNLIIRGGEIDDNTFKAIATKFKVAEGTVTIENTAITSSEGFFDVIDCQGGIVLRNNTSLSNANGFKAYTAIGGDLIVENCGMPHWGSGNTFSQIKSVAGDLRFINAPMASNAFFALETIGGDFQITNGLADPNNGNNHFWNLSEGKIKTIGGDLIYTNNSHVNGLAGLDKLTHIGGNITISGNGSSDPNGGIGEIPNNSEPGRAGFCIIKAYLEDGIISSAATIILASANGTPSKMEDITSCGVAKPSYTINGLAELQAFVTASYVGPKEVVQNLTLKGTDINSDAMSLIKLRISEVRGTLTWDEVGATTTENFFESIVAAGSIVIRNCTSLNNANGFKAYTAIGGDLIIENCPALPHWPAGNTFTMIETIKGSLKYIGGQITDDAFNSLRSVGGDLVLTDNSNIGANAFRALEGVVGNVNLSNNISVAPNLWRSFKSVGGDMEISDNGGNWNFGGEGGMIIETIGGDLTVTNNNPLNGLGGFHALTSIGGNVTITGNNGIPGQSGGGQVGFCLIKHFKDTGIIKSAAIITLSDAGNSVNVDSLTPCTE